MGRRLGAAEVHSRTQPASPSPRLVTSTRPTRPYAANPARATAGSSRPATTCLASSVLPRLHPIAHGTGEGAVARPLRLAAASVSSAFPDPHPTAGLRQAYGVLDDSGDGPAAW